MAEKKSDEDVIKATGVIKEMIDKAGELQTAHSFALKLYKKHRQKLQRLIHNKYGDDVDVYGDNFYVVNNHDKCDVIDIVDLFERIKDNRIRRKVSKVFITEARKHLKKEDLEALVQKAVPNKFCTFYVNAIGRKPRKG